MAAVHYSPIPTEIEDPVTYEEASGLFARTGHQVSVSTLRRWVHEEDLPTTRRGRRGKVEVSWSALLEVHFRRTAAKLRCSSNWP